MKTKVAIIKNLNEDKDFINEAGNIIKSGGTVAFPTETVYGLGADALVDGSSAKYHELMKTIKDAEEKMATNKVIKTHIINYAKTRETYITYRKSGYSKKFFEAHRDEITLHKAAKEAFSKLPDGKIPKVKDLNEEFVRLLSEKKADYSEYK